MSYSAAQEKLLDTLSNLPRFVSHSTGPRFILTSSIEDANLKMLKDGTELKAALHTRQDIAAKLDQFESSFNAVAALGHSTSMSSRLSESEIEEMLDRIDAVRNELT